MVSFIFEKAQNQFNQQLPFVLYRKPKEQLLKGIFQRDDQLHTVGDFTEKGFVLAPFDDTEKPTLIKPDEMVKEPIEEWNLNAVTKNPSISNNEEEKKGFESLVEKAIEVIRKKELEKVVVSRKKEVQVAISAIHIFKKLVYTYNNALCYVWYHPKVGVWLGATPEILVKTVGTSFTTMSLAGTQVFDENIVNPEWGKKELHEQQLVTDYIEQVLQGKIKALEIGDQESTRAGKLWHLRTKISGNFEKDGLGKLIRSLHPTPAVCGIPKKNAKDFILKNENYNRLFYTGFLGELNFKQEQSRNINLKNKENSAYKSVLTRTELYVNLRCMQLNKGLATLYVGGGITWGSEPQKEWEETENKSETILKVLSD